MTANLTVETITKAMKGNDFWLNRESDAAKVVEEATRRGFIKRLSHTQAQWTEAGLAKARAELTPAPKASTKARRHVIHFRPVKGYVACGADRQRRTWGVVRDVDAVPTIERWDALPETNRCTRCAARVAKMKDVKAKNDARAKRLTQAMEQRERDAASCDADADDRAAAGLIGIAEAQRAQANKHRSALSRLRARAAHLGANDGASMGLLF